MSRSWTYSWYNVNVMEIIMVCVKVMGIIMEYVKVMDIIMEIVLHIPLLEGLGHCQSNYGHDIFLYCEEKLYCSFHCGEERELDRSRDRVNWL